MSDDPLWDYQNFERNSKRLEQLFVEPSENEQQEMTIDFCSFGIL